MSGQRHADVETAYSWVRLAASLLLSSIAGVGMWSVVVALPAVQAEFGALRGAASLSYTLTMLGFAFGSVLMGRLADRHGIVPVVCCGATALLLGYVACANATSLWQFALAHGILIGGLGASGAFAPLIADISRFFDKRRGIAVSVCASGSYMAGAVWPGVVQHFVDSVGWRQTHVGIGLFCFATMLPLALLLRPRPVLAAAGRAASFVRSARTLGLSPGALQALLWTAGLCCCVAMSMPQVHLVAYCGDLGYGAARGAQMLSLMLACGVAGRIGSGFVADRIGGLATVLLGSVLQALALSLYLLFDGLVSLYVISALFGLFQGGIVPSYALVVREYFPAEEAGARVGVVLMATMLGMALGGWMSGAAFDLTGSYEMAFLNGMVWNLLNALIVASLLARAGGLWAFRRAHDAERAV